MTKKIVLTLFIIFILGFFYNLGWQIYESFHAGDRLNREEASLKELQRRNNELNQRLEEVGSIQFVEEQARDKLNFSRSGETIVIIPQEEIDKILEGNKPPPPPIPNWQGWLRLFWK